jgi:hypothetical protein
MTPKKPIPKWLREWQANRARSENFAVPEGEGIIGPAEDDVQNHVRNGAAKPRKRRKPSGPNSAE